MEDKFMPVINTEAKMSDIALRWPETVKIFSRYNLDLCCGGSHSLGVAAEKHKLNLDQLLRDLNEVIKAQAAVK
ncbi:MAG: DUF542 domain-containing protein [Terriglobia bacterium]